MFEGLFQPLHMIIILAIALIIFGPGKLPELGKGLGKAMREFKGAMSDATREINVTTEAKETPKEIISPTTMEVNQETAETVEAKKEASNRTA